MGSWMYIIYVVDVECVYIDGFDKLLDLYEVSRALGCGCTYRPGDI